MSTEDEIRQVSGQFYAALNQLVKGDPSANRDLFANSVATLVASQIQVASRHGPKPRFERLPEGVVLRERVYPVASAFMVERNAYMARRVVAPATASSSRKSAVRSFPLPTPPRSRAG